MINSIIHPVRLNCDICFSFVFRIDEHVDSQVQSESR